MLKSISIPLILLILIFGCSKEIEKNISTIEITLKNNKKLDSLIIYDKDKSWEVKSCLKFIDTKSAIDTLAIFKKKIYQIYAFVDGNQSEFGEIILSPNSKTNLTIDENSGLKPIDFSGDFTSANNFLAYFKSAQNDLTNQVRNGIETKDLDLKIKQKKDLILKKSIVLNVVDSLNSYVIEKFDYFSNILRKKNEKYLYKKSLINSVGNNFTFKNTNNESISLTSFKGKYIYIDVWATWCKPCKIEHTYLEELENYFSNNKDLQIVSISIDRDYKKWKKHVLDKSMKGIQLYSGSESDFVKFFDIGALPRFIFLDKEGRIINPDELRPSNAELKDKIESVIQKT